MKASEYKYAYGVFAATGDTPRGTRRGETGEQLQQQQSRTLESVLFASLISVCSEVTRCLDVAACCSASGKDSSAWAVRLDREMAAMELFSELVWQSNI